jgi:hypothetical protein
VNKEPKRAWKEAVDAQLRRTIPDDREEWRKTINNPVRIMADPMKIRTQDFQL